MPVALAAAATFVHLVVTGLLWFVRIPAASYLAVACLVALGAAALLLRDRERLFLWAGIAYVAQAVLALVFLTLAAPAFVPGGAYAAFGTLVALADLVAVVLFLVAFARLVGRDRALRAGFLAAAVVAGVLTGLQVLVSAWWAVGPPALVFDLALMLFGAPMALVSVVLEALVVGLLVATWARHVAPSPTRHETPA